MGRDDSAKDRLKIPSILNIHCPMRIATNSIYLYKLGLYPKKFNKNSINYREKLWENSLKEGDFPNLP